jgi:hypothetical protein
LGQHPLIELAASREAKQAAGFREAAAGLTGERLAELYARERAAAPRRREAGKRYLVGHNTKLASQRRPGRDSEHAALALALHCRSGARLELPQRPERDPEDNALEVVHALVPLRSAPVDRALGPEDPNHGVERIDALALGPGARLAVLAIRYVAPDAERVRVGDTPLAALLEGLAGCAIAAANREALAQELAAAGRRLPSDAPPLLALLGSPRYWELSRKRTPQKGAPWIKEMERLASEIAEHTGVEVLYLTLRVEGSPGWSYAQGAPAFDAAPRLAPAWESGAARVRPKPKPRPRVSEPQEQAVAADLSRPIRRYALTESFTAGDRIEHPTLGIGVVQGEAGPGKIRVLFDGRKSLLVHDRPALGAGA